MPAIVVESPVGPLTLEEREGRLCAVSFGVAKAEDMAPAPSPILEEAARQLAEYFAGRRKVFDLPLDLGRRTGFERAVLSHLRKIPYGSVESYGEVASNAGFPRAARAVGNAVHRNPLGIIVPCHRVVASKGLGGFGGRLDIKVVLLRLEGAAAYLP